MTRDSIRGRWTIGLLLLSVGACQGNVASNTSATTASSTASATTRANPVVGAGLLIPADKELLVAPVGGEPKSLQASDDIRWAAPDGDGGIVVELESWSVLHLGPGASQPTQVVNLERSTPPIAVVNGSLLWITREEGGKLMSQRLEGGAAEAIVRGNGINFANINQTATDGSTLAMLRVGESPYMGEGCVNDPGINSRVGGFPGARFEIVNIEPGKSEPANPYDDKGVQRCQSGPSTRVRVGGGHLFWIEVSPIPSSGILDFDLSTGDLRNLRMPDSSFYDVTLDGDVIVWGKWGVTVQSLHSELVAADLATEVLDRAFANGPRVAAYSTPIDLAEGATLTP